MKVKAKQLGFYGNKRRYEGDIFEITDEKHFSKKWMDKDLSPKAQPAARNVRGSDKDKEVI